MQNVSGELIVSGLDSATSLIQAAKNLMNAVVLCVKASYVASTKYPRQAIAEGIVGKPIVVWKMRVSQFQRNSSDFLHIHFSFMTDEDELGGSSFFLKGSLARQPSRIESKREEVGRAGQKTALISWRRKGRAN